MKTERRRHGVWALVALIGSVITLVGMIGAIVSGHLLLREAGEKRGC